MLITRDMTTGRKLDEACNRNNDKYDDEALYTEWASLRSTGTTPVTTLHGFARKPQRVGGNAAAAFANLFYTIRD